MAIPSPADPFSRVAAGTWPGRAQAREFFARSLAGACSARTLVTSVPAPPGYSFALLRAWARSGTFGWYPEGGLSQIGMGAARQITLRGRRRFEQLREQAEELFDGLEIRSYPGLEVPPRIVGGLAFSPGSEGGSLWEEFGDGCFVLPRWCYGYHRTEAYLSLAVTGEARDAEAALAELDEIWNVLEQPPAVQEPAPRSAGEVRLEHLDPRDWHRHVEEIRSLIATGAFRKIVAARTTRVDSEQPFDTIDIVRRLGWLYPKCTRFFFRRAEKTLVAASPESLFTKRGDELLTHALAGSIRLDPKLAADEVGEALVASRKDRDEHEVVVREITASLQPLAEELEVADPPRVMKLRDLLHLETPIRARLRPSTHASQILEALHPTPAMGGWPRVEAVRWIAEHEKPLRGWYTGPLGWIDAEGDSEFGVVIRCALVERCRAHAFAGAGIMRDSDPAMEYEETAVKLRAILQVLGVD